MANLLRLMGLVLLLLLSVGSASASVPERSEYRMSSSSCEGGTRVSDWAPFPAGVANYAGIASCKTSSSNTRSVSASGCNSATLECTFTIIDTSNTGSTTTRTVTFGPDESRLACPANSAKTGAFCICSPGYLEKGGQCVSAQDPDARCAGDFNMSGFGVGMGTVGGTKTMNGVVPSGDFCWPYDSPTSGCTVSFTRDKVTAMPDGSIQSTGTVSMYKGPAGAVQGKSCSIDATPDPGSTVTEKCNQMGSVTTSKGTQAVCADAPKCEGGFAGEVNGVEVCVRDKGGNVIETSKDTIKNNEDGSKEKVTEKTSCKGNVCTTEKTTTTTTTNNNSSSSSTTKTESREDYCKANANAAQCKGTGKGDGDGDEEKGKFGGSCEAGFSCEGDPLQCAVAKEQHRRSCQMFETPTDESKLYTAEVAKGRGKDITSNLPGNKEVDVSTGVETSDLLGGARCISDLNIVVWGQSVTLPMTDICPALGYMGWVLVAVAGLVAFRIVSGTSKDD